MKTKNKTLLFKLQTLLFVPLLLEALGLIDVPDIVPLSIAIAIPVFLKKEEIVPYIVGFSMMGTGIQVAYISLSCLVCLLVKNKWKFTPKQILIPLIVIAYELIHMLFSPTDDIVEGIRFFCVYTLLFYALFKDKESDEIELIARNQINSTVFVIIHVFIETLNLLNGRIEIMFAGDLRLGHQTELIDELTFSSDPNLLGQSCIIAIALVVLLIYKKRFHWNQAVAICVCMFGGMMTLSKTFLISAVLLLVLSVLGIKSNKSGEKTLWYKLLFLILVGVAITVFLSIYPEYFDNILNRVDESDPTTGRVNLAFEYFSVLSDNIIALGFGLGLQNVGEKVGLSGSPHAAIVELLITWGIIGLLFVVVVLIMAILHHVKKKERTFMNFVPLIIYSVIVQSTQLFRLRDKVLAIIVLISVVGLSKKENRLTSD